MGSASAPASRNSSGRTTRMKVTNAATGLPGTPTKAAPLITAIATGRPGLMATRQNTSLPTASTAARTWSASPVETPPEVSTRSWSCAAAASADSSRRGPSAGMPAIGAGREPGRHDHAGALGAAILLHEHGVGARGHRRAGEDANGLALARRPRRGAPRGKAVGHDEPRLAGRLEIGVADRVA